MTRRPSTFINTAWSACLVLCACVTLNNPAYGADKQKGGSIQVDVSSFVEPATAIGLLMSSGKTLQKFNPKIEKPSPGTITVTFPYSAAEISPDSMATALVVSEKGEVVFGNVKPITGTEVDQALGMLPLCPDDQQVSAALASQSSLLEELYRIRLKRRDQAKAQAEQLMSGEFLERLQKLERGFGLAREKELNATLGPLELIDRLTRLRDALRNWETKPEVQPTPEPTVEITSEDAAPAATP